MGGETHSTFSMPEKSVDSHVQSSRFSLLASAAFFHGPNRTHDGVTNSRSDTTSDLGNPGQDAFFWWR